MDDTMPGPTLPASPQLAAFVAKIAECDSDHTRIELAEGLIKGGDLLPEFVPTIYAFLAACLARQCQWTKAVTAMLDAIDHHTALEYATIAELLKLVEGATKIALTPLNRPPAVYTAVLAKLDKLAPYIAKHGTGKENAMFLDMRLAFAQDWLCRAFGSRRSR
jgi:hypothetical protein